eukprot:CAMPEP_0176434184 /NCGR_PEP_ID=MMETSP0127-20121128/16520_1 /TAXON_ID=938130 /ORGANISM="Platyophrya macrostoma, Strain WH" /LENGTH=100 /DNA_ID=CAMNT_0017816861 /DNA_START=151 /DNA_END=453 /DNA_ORIENTATION=-
MTSSFKRLLPALNRVLIKKIEPITKSKGGIILQQGDAKANLGEIVEVGPGNFDQNGKVVPLTVQKGDTVLLPDYGGTKVELVDGEFWVYRDTDIVGKLEK